MTLLFGNPGLGAEGRIRTIVDTAVRPLLAEHDLPGLAVGLSIDGRRFFFSYGRACRETGTTVNEHTLFEIGSVSKTFTATLAAYAQELGRLSFDDPPSRYLPQLKGTPIDGVRLLHLGTYTAGGLPLQFPADVMNEQQMIRYFQEWQPEAAPGQQRRYSNPSIGLLGRITALALETRFTDAMEDRLIPALGLSETYLTVPEHASARYAWGYDSNRQRIRVAPGLFDAEAYGIKSSAADVLRFLEINIDATGLEGSVRRAVEQTHRPHYEVGDLVQGLGWEQYAYPIELERLLAGNSRTMIMESNPAVALIDAGSPTGPTLFSKTGSTNGFGAYVAFIPQRRVGIVLLANKNYPIPARIRAAHEILRLVTPSAGR